MVNIICMKWGEKYSAAYVNILRAMVQRQLQRPHRFVCFTDDRRGIRPEIETAPLPHVDLPTGIPERCWRKIGLFGPELLGADQQPLEGLTLFLDLDVVITGNLDPFFEVPGDFVISHDYRWYGRLPVTGNSSCFRFVPGRQADMYEHFRQNSEEIRRKNRNDQVYVSQFLHAQGRLSYFPATWCPSFKSHCVPRWPLRFFLPPKLPTVAKVVIFHGNPNPPDASKTKILGPRKGWLRAPWVERHWHDRDWPAAANLSPSMQLAKSSGRTLTAVGS